MEVQPFLAQARRGRIPAFNVRDYGATGDGVTNDSAAIQAAIDAGGRTYFPAGTYLCNVTIPEKALIEGAGSTDTIVTPFSVATAAFTYTNKSDFWSYHSEVRGIGFAGAGTKTGVGFTFGATTQAGFAANDQYTNNVKFFACRFTNLEVGVLFPFGNIGTEFYSCGWQTNKYGVYAKDNSAGGDNMHAGVKYFYAGEFGGNDCGFYLHDNTDGFGAVSFHDTVFQSNLIATYLYSGQSAWVPVTFDGVWFEGNGVRSAGAATVTVDSWSGATRSDLVLNKRAIILDGVDGQFAFKGCGLLTDVHVRGTSITATAEGCRVERDSGFGGGEFTVDNPSSSVVRLGDSYTKGGFSQADGVVVTGAPMHARASFASATGTDQRWFIVPARTTVEAAYGPSVAVASLLTTAATTGAGSFDLTGSVVADGRIRSACNEFTRAAFASAELTQMNSPATSITTAAGWYVFTLDFKRTAGNPRVYIWDRGASQFAGPMQAPALNKWFTFAGIGYSAGSQTLYLDFGGGATTETCTWRVSAYQLHRFDTREEAHAFLASGVFATA